MTRHHLDRRAADLAAASAGPPDELLSTRDLCDWLGVSVGWCEVARHKGLGPTFVKLSPRCVRYRRSDVLAWLESRARRRTRVRPRLPTHLLQALAEQAR